MRSMFLCLFSLASFSFVHGQEGYQPEFTVVIPSYNNARNNNYICLKNLESVFSQTYPNFSVVYIDDCSTDDTGPIVDKFVRDHHLENKIQVIHNSQRKGCLRNLYEVIHALDPHTIVMQVDGDDSLAHERVLEHQAKVFSDKNVWITFGSFARFPSNKLEIAPFVPKKVLRSGDFRSYKDLWFPPRTFYAKLFQLIKKEDLFYKGDFYPVASDYAYMLRMLSMASQGHFKPVQEVLYVYDMTNPISDFRVRNKFQRACTRDIQAKQLYKPIQALFINGK